MGPKPCTKHCSTQEINITIAKWFKSLTILEEFIIEHAASFVGLTTLIYLYNLFNLSILKSGIAPAPFTSIFENIGNVTLYLLWANALISASVPGSCLPNWLQGKPSTTNP